MKRIALFLFILAALASCTNRQYVFEQHLDRGWTLTSDTLAPMKNFAVPSVVQQTLSDAGVIPYPYNGTVENDLLWISNHPWTYTINFNFKSAMLGQDVVELVFEGIDTYASVTLNGEKIFEADNMFRIWKSDVKSLLKEKKNQLVVSFPPYDSIQQDLYDQASPRFPEKYAVSRKAPYQHGWDWAPKYKNIGLWKPVKLVAWSDARMENAYVVTNEISEAQAKLTLHLDVESVAEGELVAEIHNEGKLIQSCPIKLEKGNQHKLFSFTIDNPQLWWPNDMGDQPLYDFEICLKDDDKLLDSRVIRTGIKTFEMVQEPDENGFSFYFKVNGAPFYAKGANYVPEEMIETWIDDDCTVNLLQEAKKAHFNMLRVWGGGIYPSEDFFNSCDSLGLLVWEDFMYAGTMYPYDEAFLENAKIEALEQVKRLASHPSLALWCGGNEISEGYYNWGWQQTLGWSAEDDQAMKAGYDRLFETILPMVVELYDGTRPYWPSSPSKGWGRPESLTQGDVHYWGVWWGEQPYEMYREKVGRFNSEYGYQSYPDFQTLKVASSDDAEFKALCEYEGDDLYSLISKNAFLAAHQKHPRGTRQINDFIERYFPRANTFEEYIYLSQLSQAYGMEIAIEAHRTAKPYNMGTLYWQLNDAWPVTSWSSIDYSGTPKAFQYKLRTLYAPVLLSFDQNDNQVFVTSDMLRGIDGMLTVSVNDFYGSRLFEQKVKVEMGTNKNRKFYVEGLSECLRNVDLKKVYLKLELMESETLLAERFCYLVYPKHLQLPEAKLDLSIQKEGDVIQVDVKSDVFAKDVQVSSTSRYGVFSDNYFDLEAGQTRRITFKSDIQEEKIDFSARSL